LDREKVPDAHSLFVPYALRRMPCAILGRLWTRDRGLFFQKINEGDEGSLA
jgi:hypothetical protein